MKQTLPYASWPSNLSADILADKGKRYGHVQLDSGKFYWLEVRASEKGRGVLVCHDGDTPKEVLPKDVSVRSKVHEYGGGDFLVADDKIYFADADDNRIYEFCGGKMQPITAVVEGQEHRYTDFCLHPKGQYLIAVRERHLADEVINDLISIDLKSRQISVIHMGFDFYSFPRISPLGHRLCWTCWNQPDMPWESAELWLADFHDDGKTDAHHHVIGGDETAIFQPAWDQNGVLHYISDASGWQNIYNHKDGLLNALTPIDRDFGTPQWIFGLGTYVINTDGSIYALHFEEGQQQLCHIDPTTGHIEHVALPFKHFEGQLQGDADALYFCAAGPAVEVAMYRYDIASKTYTALSQPSDFPLELDEISVAQSIKFPSANGRQSYGFYYPPASSHYQAPEGATPPLVVMSHGGPTAYCNNSLSPAVQFWTNRGFAVVDVNYAGSTGYGKAYRNLLRDQWGIADVEDCIAAANYLVDKGLADSKGLFIRGGSAGGYTTLCALTFHNTFTAGMSRYGVSDLEALAADSHKFEARYLDKLVGPYPQSKATYEQRSPIHHTDQLSCPILILQGTEDKVVPPNQAEMMVAVLDEKKIPHSYLLFEGEGHGFRKAETIVSALNAELMFYRQILKVESSESLGKLEIRHL